MMIAQRIVAAALVLAVSGTVGAQTGEPTLRPNTVVYKCTNADGSVIYADTACSDDPKKMEVLDTAAALRSGSGGHQQEISATVADSDCRERAYKSTHADAEQLAESARHIAEYQQRKQDLVNQAGYADASVDTTQVQDDLDAAIARESEFQQKAARINDSAYEAALRACDDELRRATLAPPTPAKAPAPAQQPVRSDDE